jgi:hypothetical protein
MANNLTSQVHQHRAVTTAVMMVISKKITVDVKERFSS